ncbi:MAG TPA: Hpt domain-containing protein, partial [Blastocatellia bacterium]
MMSKTVDNELLLGFFAEAKSYLPEIMQGVVDFRANPAHVERLENSYRYAHTIKGASSMIGLETLSRVAAHLEEIFEDIAGGRMTLNESTAAAVGYTVALISTYLDAASQGNLSERPFLIEALDSLRRLRDFSAGKGLPFISESMAEASEQPTKSEAPPENPIFQTEAEPPAFEETVESAQQENTAYDLVEATEERGYDTAPLVSDLITDADKFQEDAPTPHIKSEEQTGALASVEPSHVDFDVAESESPASFELAQSDASATESEDRLPAEQSAIPAIENIAPKIEEAADVPQIKTPPLEIVALMRIEQPSDNAFEINPPVYVEQAEAVVENETVTQERSGDVVSENLDEMIESQLPVEHSPAEALALESLVYEAALENGMMSGASEEAQAKEPEAEMPAPESASDPMVESHIEMPLFDYSTPDLPVELHDEAEQSIETGVEQTVEPGDEESAPDVPDFQNATDAPVWQPQEETAQSRLMEEATQSAPAVDAELPPENFAFRQAAEEPSFDTGNLPPIAEESFVFSQSEAP